MLNPKSSLTLLIMLVTASCATVEPLEVKHKPLYSNGIYSTSAATKAYLVKDPNSPFTVCTEPAPDASIDMQDDASVDLSLLKIGNKESELASDSEAEAGLGGRSVNVLLTRELMFRMCEFFANTNLDDSTKVMIFQSTISSILQLNAQNFGVGTGNRATTSGTFTAAGAAGLATTTSADTTSTSKPQRECTNEFGDTVPCKN